MKIFQTITIVAMTLALSACVNIRRDISDNQDAWGVYRKGEAYILTQDIFLMHVDDGLEPERLALVPPSTSDRGTGYHSSPGSTAEFEKDLTSATANTIRVEAIIPKGTEFTPHSIKRNSGWSLWAGSHRNYTIYGELLSGDFKGTIVDLSDISWRLKDKDILNQYIKKK